MSDPLGWAELAERAYTDEPGESLEMRRPSALRRGRLVRAVTPGAIVLAILAALLAGCLRGCRGRPGAAVGNGSGRSAAANRTEEALLRADEAFLARFARDRLRASGVRSAANRLGRRARALGRVHEGGQPHTAGRVAVERATLSPRVAGDASDAPDSSRLATLAADATVLLASGGAQIEFGFER